jgi:hypothetical protein
MPITTQHPEYGQYVERWQRNRAACAGQDEVKQSSTLFLPDDGERDRSQEARDRYQRYILRATWFPCAGYTKQGLLGMVFRKPPVADLPTQLEYIRENADGGGLSLTQVAKIATEEALEVGRVGILAEYPQSELGLSAEDVARRMLQARLTIYKAEAIDNWKYEMIGGLMKLTMIKLYEVEEIEGDEFIATYETRYRVLRLREGVYTQAVYDDKQVSVIPEFTPRQANGQTWSHIPFHFVGSENNTPSVDRSVLSGIVDLNTSHYQLTADSMKNLHIHSGGTMILSTDMSKEQWDQYNPNGVTVGADQGLHVGQGGSASLLQLAPASAVEEKLKQIQGQMLAIGAHLITERGDNETAEAARIDASTKSSALLTASDNVSEAVEAALEDAALFMGGNPDQVIFKLNREFYPRNVTAQDVMAAIQLQDRGVMAMADTRAMLRGTPYLDSDRTDEQIDAEAGEVEPLAPVAVPVAAELQA